MNVHGSVSQPKNAHNAQPLDEQMCAFLFDTTTNVLFQFGNQYGSLKLQVFS
jgi:hypothetical protein